MKRIAAGRNTETRAGGYTTIHRIQPPGFAQAVTLLLSSTQLKASMNDQLLSSGNWPTSGSSE
jgi:hypothetical protein